MRGLGNTTVYGRSRVPLPPARITACSDIVDCHLVMAQVVLASEPFYSAAKPLLQRDRRTEAGGQFQFTVVATKTADLAAVRPEPLRVKHGACIDAHNARNEGDQF